MSGTTSDLAPPGGVDLTAAQRHVVAHRDGPLRVLGPAGAGKTTALVHRAASLVDEGGPAGVLVITRDRTAASAFSEAVAACTGSGDPLRATTFVGAAHDLVVRRTGDVRVLGASEQRRLVASLLRRDDAARWPTLHRYLGRRAFVDAVAAAVLRYEASFLGVEELRTHADAAGVGARWEELAAFTVRYQQELGRRGAIDTALLLVRAALLLRDPAVAAEERSGARHVLVDGFESVTFAEHRLLTLLTGPGHDVTVAGDPSSAVGAARGASAEHLDAFDRRFGAGTVLLDGSFRCPSPPSVVVCRHPSIEAEAVAGEVLAARAGGVAWSDIAVLVRATAGRAGAIARALGRHGIPVVAADARPADEPVVATLVDLLRAVEGDEDAFDRLLASPLSGLDPAELRALRRTARRDGGSLLDDPRVEPLVALVRDLQADAPSLDVARLAHRAARPLVARLLGGTARTPVTRADDRGLDALTAFLDELARWVADAPRATLADHLATLDAPDDEPEPWRRPPSATAADAVTVTSITAAAGREWDTVVIAGAVEGELPRIRGRIELFDAALLGGPDVPTVAARRRRSLAEERRLFGSACARATGTVVAVAAPEPGVGPSRFVEGWHDRGPTLPPPAGATHTPLPPTAGSAPVWPDRRLRLSASQLDTFAECPLRYTYRYALGLRAEGGVQADLGSYVHAVLEEFLDPAGPEASDRSFERLQRIAAAHWRDDIARFRPQVEEARRGATQMLEEWWGREGHLGLGDLQVLKTEHRFEVVVGPHTVVGAIDRVDRADDGTGVRVVDYKTGRTEPKPDEVADDLQLATYHLAAVRDPELRALGAPTQLRLLFLRSCNAHDQPVTDDHEARTEARILAAADEILAERDAPSVDAECRWCDFHRLCPMQPEGRHVGADA